MTYYPDTPDNCPSSFDDCTRGMRDELLRIIDTIESAVHDATTTEGKERAMHDGLEDLRNEIGR